MKHIKKMKIDIDKKNFEIIPSVQYDSNTRFLHINLTNGSIPFDLTGCSVKISGTKQDGTAIFNNCTIINAKKGFVEVELTEQINAIPGTVKCELKIYSESGVLTTKHFDIEVTAPLTASKEIVSSNEFKALTDALKVVQGIDNKADKEKVEEKFGEVYEQLDTTIKFKIIGEGAVPPIIGDSGNGGSGNNDIITGITGIKVEPPNLNIKVNETADITILFDSDVTNKNIDYISSSGAIASVSDVGNYKYRITGTGQGKTSIRFRTSDGKFETSCSVTVTASSTGEGTEGNTGGADIDNEVVTNASETAITQQYSSSHEAIPNNPNPPIGAYNWLNKPRINPDGAFPQSHWGAIGHWMTTYKVQGSSYYDNVALLLINPMAWIWNHRTKKWDILSEEFEFGTWYREDFWDDGNGNIAGTTEWETGVSANHSKWVKIKQTSETSGRCFHPWGYQKNWKDNPDWSNNGKTYIVTKIDFKLIKWNEDGVDNLDKAKLVVNSGADWWRKVGDTWQSDWSTNRDMAVGKYVLATKELKRAWCTNLPENWEFDLPKDIK